MTPRTTQLWDSIWGHTFTAGVAVITIFLIYVGLSMAVDVVGVIVEEVT